jgi:hypothetical protein
MLLLQVPVETKDKMTVPLSGFKISCLIFCRALYDVYVHYGTLPADYFILKALVPFFIQTGLLLPFHYSDLVHDSSLFSYVSKGKLVPVLNKAPRHVRVLGERRYSPTHS